MHVLAGYAAAPRQKCRWMKASGWRDRSARPAEDIAVRTNRTPRVHTAQSAAQFQGSCSLGEKILYGPIFRSKDCRQAGCSSIHLVNPNASPKLTMLAGANCPRNLRSVMELNSMCGRKYRRGPK